MGVVLSDAGLYIFTAALPSLVPSLEADAIIAHSFLNKHTYTAAKALQITAQPFIEMGNSS